MGGKTCERTCWFLSTAEVNTNISQTIFSNSYESWHFCPNPLNVKYKLIWKSILRFTIGFLIWSNTIISLIGWLKRLKKIKGVLFADSKIMAQIMPFLLATLSRTFFFAVVTPEEIQIFLHNICLLLKRESH